MNQYKVIIEDWTRYNFYIEAADEDEAREKAMAIWGRADRETLDIADCDEEVVAVEERHCESINHTEHSGAIWTCEGCLLDVCQQEGTDTSEGKFCDDCFEKKKKGG